MSFTAVTRMPTQGMLLSAANTRFSTYRLGPADSDFSISARIAAITCASVIRKIGAFSLMKTFYKSPHKRLIVSNCESCLRQS